MRRTILYMAAAATLALAGCAKEQAPVPIRLVPEGMDGGAKMLVDGLYAYWDNGDQVNVNGTEATVTLDGGEAYINGEFAAEDYCIVSPASIYQGRAGSTVTVNMPTTYYYLRKYESSTRSYTQVLNAPMAYYGTAEDGTAIMRHLTGALNIQIAKPEAMRIQRIAVSTTQHHQMGGEMQFDLSNMDAIASSVTGATTNNMVEMLFGFYNLDVIANNYSTSLPNGTTCSVQIPVPVWLAMLTSPLRWKVF